MDPELQDQLDTLAAAMLVDDEHARYEAANQLARLGRPALEHALRLIHDPNPLAREMACYVLANVNDPEQEEWVRLPDGIPALVRLLEHETDEEVLASAVFALGHLVSDHVAASEAASLLCDLAAHPSVEVRYAVAQSIGTYHQPIWDERPELQAPVREALLKLAADPDEDVRDWATFGLHQGQHDTPEVRAAFWGALDDPDPDVRGEAATGLARFDDRSFIPRLERLLYTDEELPSGYFEAAEEFADPSLLPAVLHAEKLWREGLPEGEEMNVFVTAAVETLTRLAAQTG